MSAKDKLIDVLFDRLEAAHRQRDENAREYQQRLAALGTKEALHARVAKDHAALQQRFNALVEQQRVAEAMKTKVHHYGELRRAILDAHSLFDRADLPEADKLKSIHGLLDQVVNADWFGAVPSHSPRGAPPKRRRAPRKPTVVADVPAEEPEPRAATPDDAQEYVTPDGTFDAEAAAEDAREFDRDY